MSNESLSFSNYMEATDMFVGLEDDDITKFSVAISPCSDNTATPITYNVPEVETELLFKLSCNNCLDNNVSVTTKADCAGCYSQMLYIPNFRATG